MPQKRKENPKRWWERVRRAEGGLLRKLRRIAEHIKQITEGFPNAGPDSMQSDQLASTLERYGEVLEPWAELEAERMTAEIAKRDEKAWFANARKMSKLLRKEIETAPVGHILQERSRESAALISSLPKEAAARVRKLTLEARITGTRPADLVDAIQASGDVSESRARLIARTEVARTASMLTQGRSESAGSTHYVWRTVKDQGVRKSHREMEGRVCEWARPPTLSDGTTTHAGQIYNCRCFPEPIFPDD